MGRSGRAYQLLHSDAASAELEALGLDSSIFGAAGVPAPIFQALVPRRAGVFDEHAHTFGTVNEPAAFARASTAMYRDAAGVLRSAVANTIRADHDASGLFLGGLFEPAATNFIRYSNAFTTSPWGASLSPILTPNADTAPDGTASAWKIEDTGGSGSGSTNVARIFGNETVANDSDIYIASVFIEKTQGTPSIFPVFGCTITGGAVIVNALVSVNTTTGAMVDAFAADWPPAISVDAVWAEDYGAFWRCSLRFANNGTGNTLFRFRFYPAYSASLGGAADGTLIGEQTIWQADAHKSALVPNSPIATAAAAVTRAADTLSWATAPAGFNASAGLCLADVRFNSPATDVPADTVSGIFSIASSNASLMRVSNNAGGGGDNRIIIENTGGTDASADVGASVFRAVTRWNGSTLRAGYDSGSGIQWGTAQAVAAMPNDGVSHIAQSASVPVWIKRLRLFNRALTDAEIARVFSL